MKPYFGFGFGQNIPPGKTMQHKNISGREIAVVEMLQPYHNNILYINFEEKQGFGRHFYNFCLCLNLKRRFREQG